MPMIVTVDPVIAIAGRITIPPDKSIAHRVAILAALQEGSQEIVGYPISADPQSTLSVLRQLGVDIEQNEQSLVIHGVGRFGLSAPNEPLNCGNSGTTMRLMAGVLAGQSFSSQLIGDASLSSRPMERIAEPIQKMGASVQLTDGHAPVKITGGGLKGIEYELPVASAQVKSAVLLAGLLAEGTTTVIEESPSRDHTERMMGLPVISFGPERRITVDPTNELPKRNWIIPRDFSGAAAFLVAASIVQNATLELNQIGLNPTRSGLLNVLRAMGGNFQMYNERSRSYEPIADLRVYAPEDQLQGVTIDPDLVPNLIDELPLLAVAGAYANGTTTITGAAELRVKETDRIAATANMLNAMGADVEEREDGLVVRGGKRLQGATVESHSDHRIAMAAGVAALGAAGPTTIVDADCVHVSFPDFWTELSDMAGGGIVSAVDD